MEEPRITQAMIDAYDEYTHLTLDRRAFMQKLRMLAGSGAAAAAIAPLLAASKAAAEIVPADDSRLTTTDLTYRGAPGDIKAYAAMPKDATKLPAVIVIHENRGLNNHIKDVTRRMALEGFLAVAPDLLLLGLTTGLGWRVPQPPLAVLAFMGVEWHVDAPVRIGDTIHSRSRTAVKRAMREGGVIVEERQVLNQRGETVQHGKFTFLVARRPAAAAAEGGSA